MGGYSRRFQVPSSIGDGAGGDEVHQVRRVSSSRMRMMVNDQVFHYLSSLLKGKEEQ